MGAQEPSRYAYPRKGGPAEGDTQARPACQGPSPLVTKGAITTISPLEGRRAVALAPITRNGSKPCVGLGPPDEGVTPSPAVGPQLVDGSDALAGGDRWFCGIDTGDSL